jgi:CBS domain-containing protein
MATVNDLLAKKGTDVLCIRPEATVLEATQVMNRHKIGCLVVMAGSDVVGIFTERDVLRRIVAAELPPAETSVWDVMTHDISVTHPAEEIDNVRVMMMEQRIRHLPVCDRDGALQGIVSLGDVNAWEARGLEQAISSLSEYIHGRG